jgi:hypothetical protein
MPQVLLCHFCPADMSGCSIVIVPAEGLARVSEWVEPSGSWLSKLIENLSIPTQVWEYIYVAQHQRSLAQRLVADGRNLLEDLYSNFTKPEVSATVHTRTTDS